MLEENIRIDNLYNAILLLANYDEAKAFFRDLLTEKEIIEFSKRWATAQLLNNKIPYSTIEKETGLSSTTVARIAKWLKKGTGGYQLILNRADSKHHPKPNYLGSI